LQFSLIFSEGKNDLLLGSMSSVFTMTMKLEPSSALHCRIRLMDWLYLPEAVDAAWTAVVETYHSVAKEIIGFRSSTSKPG